jgi:non-heme chloroperoxidase
MRILRYLLIGVLLICSALGAMVGFGTAKTPPPIPALVESFRNVDFSDLPALQHFTARDGASLAFREYPASAAAQTPAGATPAPAAGSQSPAAENEQVAVLLHGSSASSTVMHPLAKDLARAGVFVYALDLRGHGDNRPHGDERYLGQLDDDLADFARFARPQHPAARWTVVGFSAGGSLALRFDAQPEGSLYDRYLLLAPFLGINAPTQRKTPQNVSSDGKPGVGSFAAPYFGRLFALIALDKIGIHWFDGLPVMAFAVPPDSKTLTQTYSMRLLMNLAPHPDYEADIRNLHRPAAFLVGDKDEFCIAEQFAPVIHAQRPDIPVRVLPGLRHMDLITNPQAFAAIRQAFSAE